MRFTQQRAAASAQDLVGKDTGIAEGYTDQLLSNVKTIRSNTYAKEDYRSRQ